ncbi:Tetratricopeptide repeat protein 36 homolog [Gryllus bimaculatus]|nr:Tetratricopeptide repeat protein 36 homolog [Gryllus bimaculatus]
MSSEHDAAVLNVIFNPVLPLDDNSDKGILHMKDNDEDDKTLLPIKALERDGIEAAETGNFNAALKIFSKVIEAAPTRASGYNNRAQVYRLKGETEDAVMDLNKAIELSGGHGRSACQALCQRGLIFWKGGLTDEAKKDFEAAADLGSQFAKAQLVKLNPYAALCNQMLQTVFNNLYS